MMRPNRWDVVKANQVQYEEYYLRSTVRSQPASLVGTRLHS